MTYCMKVDWLTLDGHFMRRKEIGLPSITAGGLRIAETVEELRRLPHFGMIVLKQQIRQNTEGGSRCTNTARRSWS